MGRILPSQKKMSLQFHSNMAGDWRWPAGQLIYEITLLTEKSETYDWTTDSWLIDRESDYVQRSFPNS